MNRKSKSRTGRNAARLRKTELCTNLHLKMADRRLTNRFDRALKAVAITATQFSILMAVAREYEPSITELANLLRIDRTALTRNLDVIKKQGYIRVERARAGNVRIISLTEEGQHKINEAYPVWERCQDGIKRKLGVDRWKLLMRLLGELEAMA